MRHATRLFVLVSTLALPAAILAKGKPQPMPCPPDVVAAVDAACPCAGTWKNHGAYVSCVAHERNALKKAGCLNVGVPKKGMVRCAARSTCGKLDAVVCCPTHPGTGHVAKDAASCVASGGMSEGPGSVCQSACSPSGAFLDAAF
jgi:hypothetical protein